MKKIIRKISSCVSYITKLKHHALPDFLVIGAAKAGTSACIQNLGKHPEIFTVTRKDKIRCCKNLKFGDDRTYFKHGEVRFFSDKVLYDRGPEWYSRFYEETDCRLKGEKTPIYLYNRRHISEFGNRTCDRIRALTPDIKIIILLRDPVDRSFSHWNYIRNQCSPDDSEQTGSFYTFLTGHHSSDKQLPLNENRIVTYSDYYQNVLEYISLFGHEQVYIGIQERILANKFREYSRIFDFLDVGKRDEIQFKNYHESDYRNRHLDEASVELLIPYFRDNVNRLRELLDDSLPEWRDYS